MRKPRFFAAEILFVFAGLALLVQCQSGIYLCLGADGHIGIKAEAGRGLAACANLQPMAHADGHCERPEPARPLALAGCDSCIDLPLFPEIPSPRHCLGRSIAAAKSSLGHGSAGLAPGIGRLAGRSRIPTPAGSPERLSGAGRTVVLRL